MVIVSYYYFGTDINKCSSYIKQFEETSFFKSEPDFNYLYYLTEYERRYKNLGITDKITFDTENKTWIFYREWMSNPDERVKQIDLDVQIDMIKPQDFIFTNPIFHDKKDYDRNYDNYYISEIKLNEYYLKYQNDLGRISQLALNEFAEIVKAEEIFRYIIVKDPNDCIGNVKSNAKTFDEKRAEEIDILHKLMVMNNYVSAKLKPKPNTAKFEGGTFKFAFEIIDAKNVLEKKTIFNSYMEFEPCKFCELRRDYDDKYEKSGKLIAGNDLEFDYYPWFAFDGFSNITYDRLGVYHMISDDGNDVMICLMKENDYQQHLTRWANKFFC